MYIILPYIVYAHKASWKWARQVYYNVLKHCREDDDALLAQVFSNRECPLFSDQALFWLFFWLPQFTFSFLTTVMRTSYYIFCVFGGIWNDWQDVAIQAKDREY